MLIDHYLPSYDVTEICSIEVAAGWDAAYAAIKAADLRDPLVDTLFAIRELPLRLRRRWRGEPPPVDQPVTFDSMVHAGPGFVVLHEVPGIELVVGAIGRFWRKDYGGREFAPAEFAGFAEPGYAKVALSLSVLPSRRGYTTLRYEARTGTTDEAARRTFRRYWRVIRPGVALVMRRALKRIKLEAERRVPVAA
jgi:hypothetical protein